MAAGTTRIEFTNHLMFNAVLTENEDLCRRIISAILGRDVQLIKYLDDEHAIQPTLDARGARLDVLALIDGEYVDVEMQVGIEPDIARRCRFYHSAIASRYTPKGSGYRDVPQSYVIFICLADPLGGDAPRYELATTCITEPTLRVDDGARTILLNASAWQREKNSEVAGMLEYALTGHFAGGLAKDIADAVDGKNLDRRWVRASMGVMTYEHEFLVLNQELDERRAELEAVKAQVEVAQAGVAAARADLATAQAEAQAAQAEAQSAQAEVQAAQAEAQSAQAEAQAAQKAQEESRLRERLSKSLYEEGRVDEYFAALDCPERMNALLEEFADK